MLPFAGLSSAFSEVTLEHCTTFHCTLMGIPDLPASLSIIPRFSTLLGPQCHINTSPSSISVPSPVPPTFFFVLPRPHKLWHNIENNARVPPHQTPLAETIRGTDRETENYSAGRNLIVHQSNVEGKNFLLN